MSCTSLWLMGMSGAGKSTCALRVAMHNKKAIVLDTDNLRPTLNADLGWDETARIENVRRFAHLAAFLVREKLFPIVCCSTPLKAQRDIVRAVLPHAQIIFLDAELADLKTRRGGDLYRRLEEGEEGISLAGVNFPFERPDGEPGVIVAPNVAGRQGDAYRIIFDSIEAHQP